ncbi:MAG: AraC family transcriptional regulator [Oscillospiraceae bacterium]|nr:AraC family transcriptional regulator [Oscillospiraceae bacterium]
MFSLISCGFHYVHPSGIKIDRPDGAGNYAFVFFKTPARALLEGQMIPVSPNSYIMYSPDTPQFYCHDEPPFINDWLHCEGEDVDAFFEKLDFPMDVVVPVHEPQMISGSIRELGGILRRGGGYAREIIDHEMKSFFLKLKSAHEFSGAEGSYKQYYQQFTQLRNEIYSAPGENRSVEALSAKLDMSKSYFQHIYKELFDISVKNDMISSRIEYAKHYLGTGRYSVSEVADICGYANVPHFIRQFKKYAGITPGKFYADF